MSAPQFGWKRSASLTEWLFAEPWGFDFFQAVRILEMCRRGGVPQLGEAASPSRDPVKLRSSIGLSFPASEIQSIKPGNPPELTVNFYGLAGAQGPLPLADTERIAERVWYKDTAFRDFLDIFHHRLLTLVYRVRKLHRPALSAGRPEDTRAAGWLFSTFGLGLAPLRRRMQVPDAALVFYAGILSHHPRNASGLERVLGDYYGMAVVVQQLRGRWRTLDEDQRTRIGERGQNGVLGESAVLGTKFWDQQAKFRIRLGPMSLEQLSGLLPDAQGYLPMCELVRFYSGTGYEFDFRLVLRAAEVPQARLGSSKLGWTSWLRTRAPRSDDDQVRLRGGT